MTVCDGPEVDAAYPQRWSGKVSVLTAHGCTLHCRVEEPKGDPGNTLSREEITANALAAAPQVVRLTFGHLACAVLSDMGEISNRAVASREGPARIIAAGFVPMDDDTPQRFGKAWAQEAPVWGRLLQAAGVQPG
jgi:hypothetical protein